MSVSRVGVQLRFNNGLMAEGELNRVLAPRTVEAIIRSLPIEGVVDVSNGILYFPTGLGVGTEKPVPMLQQGSMAYWPMCGGICLSLEPAAARQNMSMIGRIMSEVQGLRAVRAGSSVRLSARGVDPNSARARDQPR